MKISVDTNVLARAIMRDHPEQSRTARALLKEASDRGVVAMPV